MEEPRTLAKPLPVAPLGIAAILTLVGWGFCGIGVYAVARGSWTVATVAVMVAIVVWVFAFNWFAFSASLASFGEVRIHALLAARDDALRRVEELRRYANFCELEAGCWPEDSSDRSELLAYASVARLQADEALFRWREIERELRAQRFEQIVGSR